MLKENNIISPWLFPDADGQQSDPNVVYRRWMVCAKQHNIHASRHELQHTFISLMQNDMPEQMLKRTVGHTQNMDIHGVYAHAVNGEAVKAVRVIDGVFDGLL